MYKSVIIIAMLVMQSFGLFAKFQIDSITTTILPNIDSWETIEFERFEPVTLSEPRKYFGEDCTYIEYGRKQGLPGTGIYCLHQDPSGVLWIGTYSGFMKFDGTKLWRYKLDHPVSKIVSDKDGNLWMATLGLGVIVFHQNEIKALPYQKSLHPNSDSHNHFRVLNVLEDGSIFVAGESAGFVFKKEKNLNSLKQFHFPYYDLGTSSLILDMVEYEDSYWLATFGSGIIKLNHELEIVDQIRLKHPKEMGVVDANKVMRIDKHGAGLIIETRRNGIWKLNDSGKIETLKNKGYLINSNFRNETLFHFNHHFYNPKGETKFTSEDKSYNAENGLKISSNTLAFTDYNKLVFLVVNESGHQIDVPESVLEIKAHHEIALLQHEESVLVLDQNFSEIGDIDLKLQNRDWQFSYRNNEIIISAYRLYPRAIKKPFTDEAPLFENMEEVVKKYGVSNVFDAFFDTTLNRYWMATSKIFGFWSEESKTVTPILSGDLFLCIADLNDEIATITNDSLFIINKLTGEIRMRKVNSSCEGLEKIQNYLIVIYPDQINLIHTKTLETSIISVDDQTQVLTCDDLLIIHRSDDAIEVYQMQDGKLIPKTILSSAEIPINSNKNVALTTDDSGNLWVVNGKTLKKISLLTEKSLPNRNTHIHSVKFNNDEYYGLQSIIGGEQKIIELPSNYDELKVQFGSIELPFESHLRYYYMLEGLDSGWTGPVQESFLKYNNLEYGAYELKIKACDQVGNCDQNPTSIRFKIAPHFWQTWWFRGLMILTFFLCIWSFIKYRERNLKAQQKVLENKVLERTKEVVAQKEEIATQKDQIELQHHEIKQSIQYALNIQKTVLPDPNFVNFLLPDSFIYYKPRDIVSGDFYAVHELDKNVVMFAAIDCTGHGVPGAFVSIVGNNAIQRVLREERFE
ncbi:MAG: hypothetical protein MRY83_23260, partial [Flavobacteriales bacterium]|nr:hypothetical protein [Flavobacteriales bacterium]